MSHKPTIRYKRLGSVPTVGMRALVELAEKHHTLPDSPWNPDRFVTTSAVQKVDVESGEFETLNTLYVPAAPNPKTGYESSVIDGDIGTYS